MELAIDVVGKARGIMCPSLRHWPTVEIRWLTVKVKFMSNENEDFDRMLTTRSDAYDIVTAVDAPNLITMKKFFTLNLERQRRREISCRSVKATQFTKSYVNGDMDKCQL